MRYLNALAALILDIIRNRSLLWQLTKRDFRQRYLGSYLGILWAFIQPAVTVLILWFVFQVGFKAMPVENFPFILWLVCGMFPWFFLSESVLSATGSVVESSYLVKQIVFRVELLPIVKIMSALVVHVFFVAILFAMFALYGYSVSIYNLQILYYFFAARRGAVHGNGHAVRLLGNANFLEPADDTGAVPVFFKAESGVLRG